MKKILTVMVSVLCAALVMEGLLRTVLDPPQLYRSVKADPAHQSWKNSVKFWQKYSGETIDHIPHDSSLGWDIDIGGDRIRNSQRIMLAKQSGITRIVAAGDSYTYGQDVGPRQNYSALLDQLPGIQVLNMGVSGYGIDQAFLKYRAYGKKYDADIVLFNIYVGDYERSTLSFTAFAKPRFACRQGELTLQGLPVPPVREQLSIVDQKLKGRLYLVELGKKAWNIVRHPSIDPDVYFDNCDPMIEGILAALKKEVGERKLLLIHIPRAEAFTEADAFRDEMHRRLLRIYARLELDYIDLREEFSRSLSGNDVFNHLYFVRENGSAGHLSPAGHKRVTELVINRLGWQGE